MLDQSFSAKCFQEIFDKENRKGYNVEKKFKSDFQKSIAKLKEIQNISKLIKSTTDINLKKSYFTQKKKLKEEREHIITNILEAIALNTNKHKIKLILGEDHGGQSYLLEKKVENFFISKKIQENISETYNVRQAARYSILSEFINMLEDKFPKYVIRLDIKSFYESIPQKPLLDKINNDNLLSIKTKTYIKQVFDSYNLLTQQTNIETNKGVPRGIGISAYLAELFMRKIDNKIRELSDIVYYARYVDDIIAVFIPTNKNIGKDFLKNYLDSIKKIIKEEAGDEFIVNKDKTKEYNLLDGISSIEFSKQASKIIKSKSRPIMFLGYRIGSIKEDKAKDYKICVELSEHKIEKYKDKIKIAFNEFEQKRACNASAFKMLNARIKYLTSNTRLKNNKNNVFVGIYYSNPFLNSKTSLDTLQRSLKYYIGRAKLNDREKRILNSYSFISGFENRTFNLLPFKNKKYKNYNCNRQDIANKKNRGIVQFGITEINSIWK